jgi:hypothetical protein
MADRSITISLDWKPLTEDEVDAIVARTRSLADEHGGMDSIVARTAVGAGEDLDAILAALSIPPIWSSEPDAGARDRIFAYLRMP